jgi:hypothetical protein
MVKVTPSRRYLRERTPGTPVQEAWWAPEPVWIQTLKEKSVASAGDRTPAVQSPGSITAIVKLGYKIESARLIASSMLSLTHLCSIKVCKEMKTLS